jgi:hypothetical protein
MVQILPSCIFWVSELEKKGGCAGQSVPGIRQIQLEPQLPRAVLPLPPSQYAHRCPCPCPIIFFLLWCGGRSSHCPSAGEPNPLFRLPSNEVWPWDPGQPMEHLYSWGRGHLEVTSGPGSSLNFDVLSGSSSMAPKPGCSEPSAAGMCGALSAELQ